MATYSHILGAPANEQFEELRGVLIKYVAKQFEELRGVLCWRALLDMLKGLAILDGCQHLLKVSFRRK